MEFRVLGPLEVVDRGESLALGGSTRRALLAYLLLHANRAVPSDELIEALWDGRPPETAPSSLQNHVSRLRRVVGADRLLTRERGYELRVEPGELDLDLVGALVREAEQFDLPHRSAKLREALGLWRGTALAELDGFEFARAEEDLLEERRLDLLEDCFDADLAAGRADGLVSELQSLVAVHPFRERLRGQLMVALYVNGRQAEALDVYRAGRERLVEEAGLEPGPALRELERAILRQELAVAAPVGTGHAENRSRSRLRPSVSVVLAALVIAAVALGATVAVHHDAPSALAAIPANSVGVIDPDRNEVVLGIAVGRRPVSVAAGSTSVWVANSADETVSQIDPASRELVKNVPARTAFGSVRIAGKDVWAVGRAGLSPRYEAVVSLIDPDLAAVMDGSRHEAISIRYDESLGIGAGFGSIWVTAGWRLLRLNRAGRVRAAVEEFSTARGLAVGAGSVWVGDVEYPSSTSTPVLRVDPPTNTVAARIPVAAEVAAIAVGEGAVWVASDNGVVTRIDPASNVATATIDLGGAPSDIAVGFGAVWVANSGGHNVARIDPASNKVVATIPTGTRPDGIAVGDDAVWVTAY